jgi:arginine deiminase
MHALDKFLQHTPQCLKEPDHSIFGCACGYEQAQAELAAMRQLISEQMERIAELQDKLTIKTLENLKGQSVLDDAHEEIKQQQAVVDAAEVAVHEANNPHATARDIINAIDALATALSRRA